MRETERHLLEKERDRLARRIPRLEGKLETVKGEYAAALEQAEGELTLARRQHADLLAAVGAPEPPKQQPAKKSR